MKQPTTSCPARFKSGGGQSTPPDIATSTLDLGGISSSRVERCGVPQITRPRSGTFRAFLPVLQACNSRLQLRQGVGGNGSTLIKRRWL